MDPSVVMKIFTIVFLAVLAAHLVFHLFEAVLAWIGWKIQELKEREFTKKKRFKHLILFSGLALLLIAAPEHAQASSAIADFATPLQKVLDTITGPIGRIIAIAGVLICGVMLTMRNEEISEGMKGFLKTVFGICFIALAANIVDGIFSFSGAVV